MIILIILLKGTSSSICHSLWPISHFLTLILLFIESLNLSYMKGKCFQKYTYVFPAKINT